MKKHLRTLFSFLSVLAILCFIFPANAKTKDGNTPHQYLGIPFAIASSDDVNRILLEEKGVPLEISSNAWSGTAYGIADFGYQWNMQVSLTESYIGVNRILLSSSQSARVNPEAFHSRLQSDFQQFIDVERQLTALYGEPDTRYFFIISKQDGKTHKYMFPNGTWKLRQMMRVCEEHSWFWAYSLWDNVLLKAWVDWESPNVAGDYLSRIMLYYYPEIDRTKGVYAVPVSQYPSSNDD